MKSNTGLHDHQRVSAEQATTVSLATVPATSTAKGPLRAAERTRICVTGSVGAIRVLDGEGRCFRHRSSKPLPTKPRILLRNPPWRRRGARGMTDSPERVIGQ
jgi:hypothetical protein